MAFKRVNKVFIGKDISRDAQVVAGIDMATLMASTGLAEGEIVVLDKNKKVLGAGATISDTDTIYIARGKSRTFNYTNEAGTTVTDAREIEVSDPIVGKLVKRYAGLSYEAPTQEVVRVTPGSITPVIGAEYGLRIVYKDIEQHPGQFTHTYRVVSTGTTVAGLIDQFVAAINADKGTRVTASDGTTYMDLTAKVVNDNESIDSINEYSQVNFEVFDVTENVIAASDGSIAITAYPDPGAGHWRLVRDREKLALGYKGVTNRVKFPVIKPDMAVVKDETYDSIIIDHNKSYLAANNQYSEEAIMTTEIYIPVPASSNQMADILAVLNPWMASAGFETVSV